MEKYCTRYYSVPRPRRIQLFCRTSSGEGLAETKSRRRRRNRNRRGNFQTQMLLEAEQNVGLECHSCGVSCRKRKVMLGRTALPCVISLLEPRLIWWIDMKLRGLTSSTEAALASNCLHPIPLTSQNISASRFEPWPASYSKPVPGPPN